MNGVKLKAKISMKTVIGVPQFNQTGILEKKVPVKRNKSIPEEVLIKVQPTKVGMVRVIKNNF